MAFGGSSTYQPGSSTTTVQTRPGGVDPTAALMSLLARERDTLEERQTPAAAPAPPRDKAAAAPPPAVQYHGPTSTDAARALASRPSAEDNRTPIYRKLVGGANAVPGWINVDEAEPGAVFAGYRNSPPPGPTTFTNQSSRANSNLADTPFTAGPAAPPPAEEANDGRGGSAFERLRMANALTRSNAEYAARSGGR